jgi:hypothetical protein
MGRLIPIIVSAVAGGALGLTFWLHGMPVLSLFTIGLFVVITAFSAFGSQESWDRWFWWLTV